MYQWDDTYIQLIPSSRVLPDDTIVQPTPNNGYQLPSAIISYPVYQPDDSIIWLIPSFFSYTVYQPDDSIIRLILSVFWHLLLATVSLSCPSSGWLHHPSDPISLLTAASSNCHPILCISRMRPSFVRSYLLLTAASCNCQPICVSAGWHLHLTDPIHTCTSCWLHQSADTIKTPLKLLAIN